jgi:uncharacterized protein YdaU (DUF1376 family)
MRIVSLVKLLLGVTLYLPLPSESAETYRWVDSSGKVHFSDREPLNQKSASIDIEQIKTLKFSQIKSRPHKQKKAKKRAQNTTSKCSTLKQQIAKLESSLTMRQTARDFDEKNKYLVKLRWQKIKSC